MSGPARDLPVGSPAVEQAVELARRGVITHLTVGGERVAAIVPESVIEALRAAEDGRQLGTAWLSQIRVALDRNELDTYPNELARSSF